MENTNETMIETTTENGTVDKSEKEDTMGILHKFCWPGFIMPQFWGIGNGLKIGLLAFIPIVFPFIAIMFGINGYSMAYEESRYSKVAFYDTQIKWRKAVLIYVAVFIMILLVFHFWGR